MAISRYTWYNCVKFILYLQWFCTVISPMTLFKGIYFFNNVIMAIYELLIVSRWSICMIRRIKNFRIISAFHVLILIIYYQDYHNDILLMWKEILKPLSVCSEILVYILTSFLWVNITNLLSVRIFSIQYAWYQLGHVGIAPLLFIFLSLAFMYRPCFFFSG